MPAGEVARALAADPAERGRRLLDLAEDQWFERKSRRTEPRRLAETLVGFANADGGTIVVGLSAGVVEGTGQDPRRRNEQMRAPIDLTEPVVAVTSSLFPCVRHDGASDALLVFDVEPGTRLHATKADDVFLRVGDTTRRLNFAQRRELGFDKGQSAFESELTTMTVDDLDPTQLRRYVKRLGAADGLRLLRSRGLANEARLTVAGALLFALEPWREYPNAHVRVCRFRGTQRESGRRQNLSRDTRIEGPIPKVIPTARRLIQQWQPIRRALMSGGVFDDIGIVPEDAWLEGLVNAVVHRSYSISGDHIRVDIFDDRIEIESPGRFPALADLTHPLETNRFARNPRIARVCADLRIGQEFGEGIRRMFQEMRLAGLVDPLYHQTSGSVRLTLSGESTHRDLDSQLPGEVRLVTAALREAERLSTGEIADVVGLARPTMIRHLQILRDAGIIEWVGKSPRDPRAYWRLPN